LLRLVDLLKTDDIWVSECLEDFSFTECTVLVFFAHLFDVDLLDDRVRFITSTLYKKGFAEAAFTKDADFFVSLCRFLCRL